MFQGNAADRKLFDGHKKERRCFIPDAKRIKSEKEKEKIFKRQFLVLKNWESKWKTDKNARIDQEMRAGEKSKQRCDLVFSQLKRKERIKKEREKKWNESELKRKSKKKKVDKRQNK